MDSLDHLRAAVHRDPKGVGAKAIDIVVAARAAGDRALLSRALSVLGRARRSLGEIDLAEGNLDEAIVAASAAHDDELGADARIALAGVLSFAGRSEEAFARLDEAARMGSDRLRAYASLQRAVIEQRLGRRGEAVRHYDVALPMLRQLDARTDIAMLLVNRGVNRIHAGRCDEAVADLSEARGLFAAEADDFGVARTLHGLGWAYARRGEIPQSLQHLDEATAMFRDLGHDALEVDVDRVEVLLAAGLFVAAGELARATAAQLSEAGNHSEAAEVWLHGAQAAAMDGDWTTAADSAERARNLFAGQGAVGWEQAARLEVLRCGEGDVEELVSLAAQLRSSGNARGAATATALAAVAACRRGDVEQGSTLAADCRRSAARLGLFEVRMQAAHALATCASARGDLRTARRRLRLAFDDLARHRTSMQATDARAAVAAHAAGLVALGLRLAWDSGSAAAVLTWLEYARAGRGRDLPPQPPEDPELAALLTDLRAVVALRVAAPVEGDDRSDLLVRQRDLERAIHSRQLRTAAVPEQARVAAPGRQQLQAALGDRVLVELAAIDGRLVGVTVDRRNTRLADLGAAEDLYGVVATALTALRASVAAPTSGRRHDARGLLRRSLAALDSALRDALTGDGPVVLVVPPALHVVPWQLLPCLTGRGVAVAPSASWWLRVRTSPAPPGGPAALVAGPRLAEADQEVRCISGSYPGARILTGPSATSDAVIAALAGAGVAHIACHGRIRYDNPLWSSLDLYDGPVCVYDLERLPRTPALVVLSGCDTGVGVRAGDRLLGLSATFLEHGTRSLVAAVCPLPDSAATRETMIGLHEQVSGGVPPATALARLSVQDPEDPRASVAACLSCFGAG